MSRNPQNSINVRSLYQSREIQPANDRLQVQLMTLKATNIERHPHFEVFFLKLIWMKLKVQVLSFWTIVSKISERTICTKNSLFPSSAWIAGAPLTLIFTGLTGTTWRWGWEAKRFGRWEKPQIWPSVCGKPTNLLVKRICLDVLLDGIIFFFLLLSEEVSHKGWTTSGWNQEKQQQRPEQAMASRETAGKKTLKKWEPEDGQNGMGKPFVLSQEEKTHISWNTSRCPNQTFNLQNSEKKNKMKPTNPNADTYVDKQRQYLFVTFPANSLVRHPEFTHWSNTLVGHPCLTLLRNALVRDACLTLLWDTLVRHFLLDTLVRQGHSYLTFLTWHSCKTLL